MRLVLGAWKAVEDDATCVLGQLCYMLLEQCYHHVVGNEVTARDDGVDLLSEVGAACYLSPQQVACGEVE